MALTRQRNAFIERADCTGILREADLRVSEIGKGIVAVRMVHRRLLQDVLEDARRDVVLTRLQERAADLYRRQDVSQLQQTVDDLQALRLVRGVRIEVRRLLPGFHPLQAVHGGEEGFGRGTVLHRRVEELMPPPQRAEEQQCDQRRKQHDEPDQRNGDVRLGEDLDQGDGGDGFHQQHEHRDDAERIAHHGGGGGPGLVLDLLGHRCASRVAAAR